MFGEERPFRDEGAFFVLTVEFGEQRQHIGRQAIIGRLERGTQRIADALVTLRWLYDTGTVEPCSRRLIQGGTLLHNSNNARFPASFPMLHPRTHCVRRKAGCRTVTAIAVVGFGPYAGPA